MSCNYTIPLFLGMVLIARFGGLVVKVDAFGKTPSLPGPFRPSTVIS
jgi:hypothetical protein